MCQAFAFSFVNGIPNFARKNSLYVGWKNYRFFYGYTELFKITHFYIKRTYVIFQETGGIAGEPEIVHVRKLFNPAPSM